MSIISLADSLCFSLPGYMNSSVTYAVETQLMAARLEMGRFTCDHSFLRIAAKEWLLIQLSESPD